MDIAAAAAAAAWFEIINLLLAYVALPLVTRWAVTTARQLHTLRLEAEAEAEAGAEAEAEAEADDGDYYWCAPPMGLSEDGLVV